MKNLLCFLVTTFLLSGCSHTQPLAPTDPSSCAAFSNAIEPNSDLRYVTCMEKVLPEACAKAVESGDMDRQIACFGMVQVACKKQALELENLLLDKFIDCLVNKTARKL